MNKAIKKLKEARSIVKEIVQHHLQRPSEGSAAIMFNLPKYTYPKIPCPDCKPDSGEFVKEAETFRNWLAEQSIAKEDEMTGHKTIYWLDRLIGKFIVNSSKIQAQQHRIAELEEQENKKYITLVQAREMALFVAERDKQRGVWEQQQKRIAELEEESKDVRLGLALPMTMGTDKEPLYKVAAMVVCELLKLETEIKDLLDKPDRGHELGCQYIKTQDSNMVLPCDCPTESESEFVKKYRDFLGSKLKNNTFQCAFEAILKISEYGNQACDLLEAKDRIVNGLTATLELRDNALAEPESGEERMRIDTVFVCPCGRLMFDDGDFATLGSESGRCCPDCGSEKFKTIKTLLDEKDKRIAELESDFEKAKKIINDLEYKELDDTPLHIQISKLQKRIEEMKTKDEKIKQ